MSEAITSGYPQFGQEITSLIPYIKDSPSFSIQISTASSNASASLSHGMPSVTLWIAQCIVSFNPASQNGCHSTSYTLLIKQNVETYVGTTSFNNVGYKLSVLFSGNNVTVTTTNGYYISGAFIFTPVT